MSDKVLVINPNSNAENTRWIDEALEPLRSEIGPRIECRTLARGPHAIETELHGAQVVAPLCELVAEESEGTGAFVVACYSDPGLLAAREVTDKPVFGICEAALTTALNLGDRIGMLHNDRADIAPAMRGVRSLGLQSRVVGGRSINVPMSRLDDTDLVFERMTTRRERLGARPPSQCVGLRLCGDDQLQIVAGSRLRVTRRRSDASGRRLGDHGNPAGLRSCQAPLRVVRHQLLGHLGAEGGWSPGGRIGWETGDENFDCQRTHSDL